VWWVAGMDVQVGRGGFDGEMPMASGTGLATNM